jgi:uncharacterized protein (DUF608 family)
MSADHRHQNSGAPEIAQYDGGEASACTGESCCCGPKPALKRRDFIKLAGYGMLAMGASGPLSVMAGPFSPAEAAINHLVPADKRLDPAWVRALYERGTKEVFRGKALEKIGMPCGGIGTGQLYLCGDGTLGCWQIFNNMTSFWVEGTNATYAHTGIPKPVDQGFAVTVRTGEESLTRTLCAADFPQVEFQGEYPIGRVRYADSAFPLAVEMEAFSPYIPLNALDSALPATLFHLHLKNISDRTVTVSTLGWLENAVCYESGGYHAGTRITRFRSTAQRRTVVHAAEPGPKPEGAARATVFADFDGSGYGEWTAKGEAFGTGPAAGTLEGQNPVSGYQGAGLVNSFLGGDVPTGTLTSPGFVVTRPFINFLIGGGAHRDKTCINFIVDGAVQLSVVGKNTETLEWAHWDVRAFLGKEAHIEIVDASTEGWGHVNVDQIEFDDRPRASIAEKLELARDFGELALACMGPDEIEEGAVWPPGKAEISLDSGEHAYGIGEKRLGVVRTAPKQLAPGESCTAVYALAWRFPHERDGHGWMYATRFANVQRIIGYCFDHHERLAAGTRLWRDTYYDSTLPYWLLDRLHSTLSYLATGTCQWWGNGRFYAWEGNTCCAGNCTHVWNYAHGHARLFPELGRNVRERQDFSSREEDGGFHVDTGLVGFRSDDNYAADGQCGTVLKAYREHLMSADSTFLKRLWPRIRKALEFSIAQDENADGLIENSQHNTYDINYHGANTFVGALYLAALRAGEAMAREVGDGDFADRCRTIFEKGQEKTLAKLWDGEYFIQDVDLEAHPQHQYGRGCLSDQLFGQGWAHQLGLGYLYPAKNVREALASVWKYNWAPDVTAYNEVHPPFRWFVSPGQAGLFTCTWPKSEHLSEGTLYREEVWTGIEYQVAGHMIHEGMLEEGLAICRAVHDRYHPELFNPYNEVECGDHYARALASWGVYLALLGFENHGPRHHLGFSPRISPENFKAAFTAPEGWGAFEQRRDDKAQTVRLTANYGVIRVKTLALALPDGVRCARVAATRAGETVEPTFSQSGARVEVTFPESQALGTGESLDVVLTR